MKENHPGYGPEGFHPVTLPMLWYSEATGIRATWSGRQQADDNQENNITASPSSEHDRVSREAGDEGDQDGRRNGDFEGSNEGVQNTSRRKAGWYAAPQGARSPPRKEFLIVLSVSCNGLVNTFHQPDVS